MRWVTKEDNISTLIEYGKENLSSDKYLFVTTLDMIEQVKMNLETFCKKIDQKTIISGYKEKQKILQAALESIVDDPGDHPRPELVILGIKKELIEKEELENFVVVNEELLPIIQIINSLEGSPIMPRGNKEELDWFVDKIHGKKIEYTDHYAVYFTEKKQANLGVEDLAWGETKFKPRIERFRPSAEIQQLYAWKLAFGNSRQQSDLVRSEVHLRIAIALDCEYYFAMEQLASLYIAKNQPTKALPWIEKALEINPKFSYLRMLKTFYYLATKQFDLALIEVEKIDLEKQPDTERVNIILIKSKAKLLMGDLDGALSYFEEASLLCPPDKPIEDIERSLYFGWSECLKRKGDYPGAIKIMKLQLKKDPDNTALWNNLGFQYSALGEGDKAIDAYEHSHKIDDKEPNVLMNLGVEYIIKNEPQKALQYYEKAKISLEEGYEKFTEIVDGKIVTKELLALVEEAISILTGANQESIKSFITTLRERHNKRWNLKFEEEYKIPYIPLKQRRKNLSKCRETIQNYIRKKFGANPNKFKNEFESTYKQATKLQEEGKNSVIPRKKDTDFFSYLDYGDFPYIIQNKLKEWEIGRDALNMLYLLKSFRNVPSHFDGEEEGDLDKTSAANEFYQAKQITEMFEKKINE